MSFRRLLAKVTLVMTILTLGLAAPAADDKSKDKNAKAYGTPVLWREPADIASLNLLLGPGGEEMKPDTRPTN